MRDWLTEKLRSEMSDRATGWRKGLLDIVDLNRAAFTALSQPTHTAGTIILDDEENYRAALEMAWRGIMTSLVIFGALFSLITLVTGQDVPLGEFLVNLLLGLYIAAGIIVGSYVLRYGLRVWKKPENLTDKRLFHVYVAWAAPMIVLTYIPGSLIAVAGAFFMVDGENVLHSLYSLAVSVVGFRALCVMMYEKFKLAWYKTLIGYFVGVVGFVILLLIIATPLALMGF
ncbi:MAG: hypothetical protein ACFB6R_07630 [Alphaproteobacteria bacterium]